MARVDARDAREDAAGAPARAPASKGVREMTAGERRAFVAAVVRARARDGARSGASASADATNAGEDDGDKGDGRSARWRGVKSRYMEYETRARETTASGTTTRGTRRRDGSAGEAPACARRERAEKLAGRHARERVVAEAMARRAEEETFRPRTHGEGRRDAGKRASLEKLAAPRTALWERSASVKKEKDEAVFAENCTFAPKVGRGPKTPSTKPAAERLYEYAEKRLETRERVQARVVEEEMELLTFKPTVNVRTSAGIRDKVAKTPPLHRRVADVLRAKENVRTEARLKVEDELAKAHTFKPTINPTSVILAMQRAEIQKAMEDDDDAGDEAPTIHRRRSSALDGEDENLTFAPKITRESERVVDELERQGKLGAGFLERQRDFSEKVARRAQEKRAMVDDECTFMPDIGNAASVLRRGRHVYKLLETPEERSDRLAVKDAERKRAAQRVREREHYAQFTYQPELNEKSYELAPHGSTIDDLARDERRDLARRRAQAELEREFREQHTFEPNLDRSNEARKARDTSQFAMDYGVGGDAVSARIEAYRREKETALENLRRRAEYRELEQCTFRPESIAREPRAMGSPSASKVKGMDSFLRKQAKARELEEEKRERYAKAFLENLDDFDRRGRRTIPEPFTGAFAENVVEKAEARRKALAEEHLRRELEECTWEPATNHSRKSTSIK